MTSSLTGGRRGRSVAGNRRAHATSSSATAGSRASSRAGSPAAGRPARRGRVGGSIVTPGFVDLHGHWYEGSAWGIDPIVNLRQRRHDAVRRRLVGLRHVRPVPAAHRGRPVRVLVFLHIGIARRHLDERRRARGLPLRPRVRHGRDHRAQPRPDRRASRRASGPTRAATTSCRRATPRSRLPTRPDLPVMLPHLRRRRPAPDPARSCGRATS